MTYLLTPPHHKLPAVTQILSTISPTPQKTILYFSTCASVDYFSHILPTLLPSDFLTVPLHGKHPATARQKNFTRFVTSLTPTVLLTTDVAARGLDIPSVDLVIQIDPPTDPKAYLHRCGRAGRAGRRGTSIILLHPGREEDYIPFLAVRKTPAIPLDTPTIDISESLADSTTSTIRKTVLTDRALHDKAQKAFVSWVRSYSKHQASSIFRVSDLDWEILGRAWGLLKLPRMPELKGFEGDVGLGAEVDWVGYGYKDKAREKHRREALKEKEENGREMVKKGKKRVAGEGEGGSISNAPWSRNVEKKSEKEKRRERKRARREKDQWTKMTEEEREKVRETERMLEQVRKASRAKETVESAEEEFEGFD